MADELSLTPDDRRELEALIQAARDGSGTALGHLLEASRPYLLHVANQELDQELCSKAGASDLVQETFLEAQQGFAGFRGRNEAELRRWLRQMLRNNLANFARGFRGTRKRDTGREVSLEGLRDT